MSNDSNEQSPAAIETGPTPTANTNPQEDINSIPQPSGDDETPEKDNDANDINSPKYYADKREDTRSKVATLYVIGFFIVIFLGFFTTWVFSESCDLKELLVAISGVLSGPLGFIIGFYFKSADK